jgi:hypothetical protein
VYGRPNPLFTFAKPYYLGPFTDAEGTDLLRGVGKQVGLTWADGALELAMAESGGSAMLIRELGSAVLKSYPENRTDFALVERADVVAVLGKWRRAVSSNLREVVLHLQKSYPDESVLMGFLMSSPEDFDALAYDFPDQVNRLHQLGVIEPVGDGWASSRILQMGWELVNRKNLSSAACQEQLSARLPRGVKRGTIDDHVEPSSEGDLVVRPSTGAPQPFPDSPVRPRVYPHALVWAG